MAVRLDLKKCNLYEHLAQDNRDRETKVMQPTSTQLGQGYDDDDVDDFDVKGQKELYE